jgi:hypothetical protein
MCSKKSNVFLNLSKFHGKKVGKFHGKFFLKINIPSIVDSAGAFENPGGALRYLVLHGVLQVPEFFSREACEGSNIV